MDGGLSGATHRLTRRAGVEPTEAELATLEDAHTAPDPMAEDPCPGPGTPA